MVAANMVLMDFTPSLAGAFGTVLVRYPNHQRINGGGRRLPALTPMIFGGRRSLLC